jgi:hypothetical protein
MLICRVPSDLFAGAISVLAACSSSPSGSPGSDAGRGSDAAADGASGDAAADAISNDAAADATTYGCSGAVELPEEAWAFDGSSGTFVVASEEDAGTQAPPNYVLTNSGSTTEPGGAISISIQLLARPSLTKVYTVQDEGVVSDPGKAFVHVHTNANTGYRDYRGIAGGCIGVAVAGTGKIVASFNQLMVAEVDAGSMPVSATLLSQAF